MSTRRKRESLEEIQKFVESSEDLSDYRIKTQTMMKRDESMAKDDNSISDYYQTGGRLIRNANQAR